MAERIVIDGLDLDAKGVAVEIGPGTSWSEAIAQLGGTFTIEHVPAEAEERVISVEAAAFLRDYEFEDPTADLAIYWRYGSLDAEEFDSAEEAERFLESGEEYGTLAGEAIVDGDKITVWD